MPYKSLYESVFPHSSSGEEEFAVLDQLTKDHPYFSLGHFFLLKKMAAGDPAKEKAMAKTALHFSNPYLLNQQLKKELKTEEEIPLMVNEEIIAVDEDQVNEVPEVVEIIEKNVEPQIIETSSEEEIVEEREEIIQIVSPVPEILATEIVSETTVPVKAEKEDLLFEPLHTTDYFASQGIKLSEEVQPTDKLGKQLRSFTDWLKTMKKVRDSKLPEGSEQLDASVNKLAEKSNKDEEIITEAMAEAYIIQGKPEKAKDVYLKLSLLNPSKNAYFAAKIDQIAW